MSAKDDQSPTCIGVGLRLRVGDWVRLCRRLRARISLGVCMDVVREDGQKEKCLQEMEQVLITRIMGLRCFSFPSAHGLTQGFRPPQRLSPICHHVSQETRKSEYLVSIPPNFFVAMSARASVCCDLLPKGVKGGGRGETRPPACRLSMEGVVWTTETCLILTVVMQPVVDVDDALRAANVVNMIRGLQRSRCE